MGNENEIEAPEPLCFIHDIIPLYFVTKDFDIDHIKYNYAYIMDAKGIKILKRSAIGTFLVDANKLEELPTIDEKIAISTEKIPSSIIQKTLAWFKRVYQDQTSEAIVFLFYHHTHGWEVKPPKQTAIGMSVDYEERPEMDGDGWTIAGTIHSHCNSSAFHSGTDESDEKEFDGIHLTIG